MKHAKSRKKLFGGLFECRLVACLCGFISSLLLSFVVLLTVQGIGYEYEIKIMVVVILISIIWFFLLVNSRDRKSYNSFEISVFVFLFICLGMYFVNAWHQGYISNSPLVGINAIHDGIHRDTLYHNAIASSIEYYGYPSLLVNSDAFHNYHFGSHLILALISKALRIPTIYCYCYLYPVIFFPFLSALVFSVGQSIRAYLKIEIKISISDIIVLMSFLTFYFFPQNFSTTMSDGNSYAWLISESYCISIVLVLCFFKLCIYLVNNRSFSNHYGIILYFVIPLFIVYISLTKISVGLIFSFIILYFIIRKNGTSFKNITLGLLYMALALLIHYAPLFFYSPFRSGSNEKLIIKLFAFQKEFLNVKLWGLHVVFLFSYAIIFLCYRLKNNTSYKSLFEKIKAKEIIVEETFFWTCIIGFLPGILIDIGGGSAFYFFSIQRLIAVVLLIGYNIPNEVIIYIKNNRSFINRIVAFIIATCIGFDFIATLWDYTGMFLNDCIVSRTKQYMESIRTEGYMNTINQINAITQNQKKDYYLYISETSNIWNKFDNSDCAIFFYPALTGLVCIGELYFDNNQVYTNNGTLKNGAYSYEPAIPEDKMTKDMALEKANEDGKKALIILYDDTYEVINVK